MQDGIEVIDAQIHSWLSLSNRHWPASYEGANQGSYTIECALAAMDAVGVDAAIIDFLLDAPGSTWTNNSYTEAASLRFPKRIASVVRGVDYSAPDVEDSIAYLRTRPGVLGVRISVAEEEDEVLLGKEIFFSAMQKHDVPLLVFCRGRLAPIERIARAYPDLSVFIVHWGLPQPPSKLDDPPFRRLPDLVALSACPNISVGVIGGPSMSQQNYPFLDLWPHFESLVDAFGIDRVAWGSDFSRLWGICTYAEQFGYLWYSDRLAKGDRTKIFGQNLRRILRWNQ
jgi:L-fuconolactonase